MKRALLLLMPALLALFLVGCSDDDSPTGSTPPAKVGTKVASVLDSATGVWTTSVNASDADTATEFSFGDAATVSLAATWDMKFRRTNINLNGGASSDGGNVTGADLGGDALFNEVTLADTAGVTWSEDALEYVVSSWYAYNTITHQLDMTRFVYSMVDAGGSNYLKFRIDSLVGAGQPPSMGTVWISYFYQQTAGLRDLNGPIETASITVGSGSGYFDFSSGSQVTPANPMNSSEWDICFGSYDVKQNSGPNGSGQCAAFPAYGELIDPTNLAGFMAQPAGAPMFPDFLSSVFNGSPTNDELLWYQYDPTSHTLASKSHVYLIWAGDVIYKLEIKSYYADVNGTFTSGYYTFVWKPLE